MAEHKLNAYDCDTCGEPTVFRHVDQGTTPMFMRCLVTKGCTGTATSRMYQGVTDEPTHEWYRPTESELRKVSPEIQDHVRRGGLMFREIQ